MFMKRLAAAALVVVGLMLPVFAQRSGGRGGVSGHGAPAFHGGSAPRRFSGIRGSYAPGRAIAVSRAYQRTASGAFRRRPVNPPPYSGSWRYRRPYVSPYRAVVPYGISGWVPPYYLSYPDDTGDDGSTTAANPADGYDQQADDRGPPPWPSIYDQGLLAAQAPRATTPAGEEAVTLIFKDGRAPRQIHNYILTRSTLFVGDSNASEIPVNQLDLEATARVNQDLGIDFRLPGGSR